ncbi:MAG: histidine kinase dimerization/phospho-acceptor domain-containing protein, partial [Syntrophales bacterium]|nr:histidine kinase dimerization/phospho-acceptor domain-containing protein [Syntrophales bacterium]
METFALAAISLAIAVSLIIKRKKNPIHISYAVLCFTLFIDKAGLFLYSLTGSELFKSIYLIGILLIPPALFLFCSRFLGEQGFILKRLAPYSVLFTIILSAAFFVIREVVSLEFTGGIVYFYIYISILGCSIVLMRAVTRSEGAEKKRLKYVAVAALATLLISASDIFHSMGYNVPAMSEISVAALVYFVLIIITYPKLPELYEIMMRALIIFILILFVTIVFYAIISIFGENRSYPDFNLVFMASFIVVIFIDTVKLILKKAAGYFFFEGKTTFTSLFAMDEEVEREKSLFMEDMATGLAHEIRNPLASIKGAAQYLKSEAASGEGRELFNVITEEVDRLGNVVSRFLNYAKRYAPSTALLDLNDIVERTIVLIKKGNLPDKITISAKYSDLPRVQVDGEQMTQVILNMALNGIEAMPEGGTLTFSTNLLVDEGTAMVEITVADTGIGIAHDDMKRFFEPF